MSTGTVKWFNSSKGFGFITPDDGGEDLFVHQTEIKSEGFRTLQEGEKVGYEPIEDKGKMKAVNVTSTDGGAVKGGSGGGRGRGGGRQQPRKWPEGVSPSDGKQIGAVKWFNSEKGYGFIAPAAAGEDLFVHQSAINAAGFRSLMEGEEVRAAAPHHTPRRRARRARRPHSLIRARSRSARRSSSRSSRRTARRRPSMSRGPTATTSRAPRAVAAAAAATEARGGASTGAVLASCERWLARTPPAPRFNYTTPGRTLHLLIVSHYELPI